MEYQRLEYCLSRDVLIVRFVAITQRAESAVLQVRDELIDLVTRIRPSSLAVDFEERHGWPAEILGCLSHAQRSLSNIGRIRCIGMPLQLKAACRFLRFDESVVEQFDTIKAAISKTASEVSARSSAPRHVLDLAPSNPRWSPSALARSA